jgi:chemotaxis protein methyltransferase CheR
VSATFTRRDEEQFRDRVREVLGLHFDDTRLADVAAALRERLAATRSDLSSYLGALAGPGSRAEARALAELLTVSETYFFRNSEQFRALAELAIPARLKCRGPDRTLRFLSAGCSSGEEPYTIAMVLHDSFPEVLDGWDVGITGIDVNPARLARARAGRYGAWSLREVDDAIRARWFRRAGGDLELHERIRAAVRFEERNLLDDDPALWSEGAWDVVFFRNVGMYFAPDVMRGVISRIARTLAPGGFLFLGHAENLRAISQEFHLCHSHDCFYYQRRGAERGAAPEAARAPRLAEPAREPPAAADGSWVDAIRRASERIALLEADPGARPAARSGAPPPRPPIASPGLPRGVAAAVELMREERIAEAMEALPPEDGADADAELLRAVLLTSCGRLEEAERVCARLLRRDELDAGAHYVAALCREHLGDREGAREHDRTAAYLDPGFAMPRLHLGLLARRAGDPESARHELREAEILLEREDASRILLFGGGFRREALLQLCRAELRACGGLR